MMTSAVMLRKGCRRLFNGTVHLVLERLGTLGYIGLGSLRTHCRRRRSCLDRRLLIPCRQGSATSRFWLKVGLTEPFIRRLRLTDVAS